VRDDVDFSNEPQPTVDASVTPANIERGAMLDPSKRYTLKLPVDAADDGDTILKKGLASVGQNLGLAPEQVAHATSLIYQTLKQKGRGLSYAGTNQPTTQKAVDEAKRTGQVNYVLEDPEIISRFNDYLSSGNSMQAATPQEREVLNASSDVMSDARSVGLNPRDLQLVAGAGEAAASAVAQLGANAADVVGANSLGDKLQSSADLHLQKGQAIDERRDELTPRSLGETVISEAVRSAPQMAMLGGVGEGGAIAARMVGAPALVGSASALAGMGALQNEKGGAKEMVKGAGLNALLPVVGSALSARALNLGVPQRLMGEFSLNAAPAYLATGDTDKAIAQGLIAVGMHKAGGEGVAESSAVPESARPKFVMRRDGLIDVHLPDESGNGQTVVTVKPDAPSRVEASRSLSQRMAMKTATLMRGNLSRLESGKMSRGEVDGLMDYNGVGTPKLLGQFYRDQIRGLETHARGSAPVPVSEKLREHFPDIPVEHPVLTKDAALKEASRAFDAQDMGGTHRAYDAALKAGATDAEIRNAMANGMNGAGDNLPSQPSRKSALSENIQDALNIPRTVKHAFSLTAPTRQALVLTATHPVKGARAFGSMLKAYGSQEYADRVLADIHNSPLAPVREEAGLFLSDPHGAIAGREETIASNLAGYIPGVKAGQRAQVVYLNKIRADLFDSVVQSRPDLTPEDLQGIATFINYASGRGDLGKLEKAAPALANVFFSPRLTLSRFQVLGSALRGTPAARAYAARHLVQFTATGLATLALAKAAGADVTVDPRKSDFGKIKIGNTRVDLFGGFIQTARPIAQLIGGVHQSPSGVGASSRTEAVGRFVRSRLSPQAGLVVDLATGQTMNHEAATASKLTRNLLMPISWDAIYQAVKEDQAAGRSGLRGAAIASPALFGVGVHTYPPKPATQFQFERR
jgi:hypothetical protein